MGERFDDIWGPWDDIGPYYVEAKDRTLKEAAEHLERAMVDYIGIDDPEDPYYLVSVPLEREPMEAELMVCNTEMGPCDDPNCPHTEKKLCYLFESIYREDLTPEYEERLKWLEEQEEDLHV